MKSFSHVNYQIEQLLRNQYPEYQLDIIDIWNDLISPYNFFNLMHAIREHGFKIFWGNLAYGILRTDYIYFRLKSLVRKKLSGKNYLFTFQTQSLFDLSMPGIPHFIYTDNSQLANRKYISIHDKNIFSCLFSALIRFLKTGTPSYSLKIDISRHILDKAVNDPKKIAMEKSIYQNASINFTMSNNVTQSIINDYDINPQKVACVYAGSNIEVKANDSFNREKYENKNILFVGLNWERKGGPDLVSAFLKVLKVTPDARLTIVGCVPKIKIPNCIAFKKLPLSELRKFYENASVFCLPTKWEPFGMVFIEALMFRLPIVATRIAAITDFVNEGKNGYLVSPSNPEELADALIKLINDPKKCADFGEFGYKAAIDKYTWRKTGEKIRQKIDQVIR